MEVHHILRAPTNVGTPQLNARAKDEQLKSSHTNVCDHATAYKSTPFQLSIFSSTSNVSVFGCVAVLPRWDIACQEPTGPGEVGFKGGKKEKI